MAITEYILLLLEYAAAQPPAGTNLFDAPPRSHARASATMRQLLPAACPPTNANAATQQHGAHHKSGCRAAQAC